jgi:hypothetical protein
MPLILTLCRYFSIFLSNCTHRVSPSLASLAADGCYVVAFYSYVACDLRIWAGI